MKNRIIGLLRGCTPITVVSVIIDFRQSDGLLKSPNYFFKQRISDLCRGDLIKLMIAIFGLLLVLGILLSTDGSTVVNADVGGDDIQAIFGTAVEVRSPNTIVVASSKGLITLHFKNDSELKIGSKT